MQLKLAQARDSKSIHPAVINVLPFVIKLQLIKVKSNKRVFLYRGIATFI